MAKSKMVKVKLVVDKMYDGHVMGDTFDIEQTEFDRLSKKGFVEKVENAKSAAQPEQGIE